MVELALVFFLGAFAAGLFWLLLLPAMWRRAERLTRERLERALPLDANAILAERDRERAIFAVRTLGQDQHFSAMEAEVLVAKAELGQRLAREAGYLSRIAELEAELGKKVAETARLDQEVAARNASIEALDAEIELARERLVRAGEDRSALEARLAKAGERLEALARLRDEAEVHASTARAAEEEERARSHALRVELMARQHESRESEHRHTG